MTDTVPPQTSSEVAHKVGTNVRRVLGTQGRDLTWLADQIGVTVDGILRAFTERVPFGLIFDMAEAMQVRPDTLIEGAA